MALLKAPLLVGCDVRNMTQDTKSILLASEVIALSQDPLGVPGALVWKQGPNEVYAGPLADGGRGVVFFNRHTRWTQYPEHLMTVQFTDLGYEPTTICHVRDLYRQIDLGTAQGSFSTDVDIHAGVALRITPVADHMKPHYVDWRPWKQYGYSS